MSMTTTVGTVVPMTIYTILKGEHGEVSLLFKALEVSPESFKGGRDAVFNKLRKELLSHAKAEQATVYEKLEERIIEKEVVLEAYDEHRAMRDLVEELHVTDMGSAGWTSKLVHLKELVDHHVEEEENEMFEQMRELFTEKEAEHMGKEFQEAKKKELETLSES